MPIDFRTFAVNGMPQGWNLGVPRWPGWAKAVLFVPMVPGILLLALSILLLLVSLVALFVLTAPVFMLLNRVLSGRTKETGSSGANYRSPGSKRVDAVIRDA